MENSIGSLLSRDKDKKSKRILSQPNFNCHRERILTGGETWLSHVLYRNRKSRLGFSIAEVTGQVLLENYARLGDEDAAGLHAITAGTDPKLWKIAARFGMDVLWPDFCCPRRCGRRCPREMRPYFTCG
ncbi:hypothetical protein L3X38_036834 [Prunus dulcis]|uniref:Uncharacterized protein n=1 Tax=Prunus dulcis TaxID=3755 RepID=A0AAD4V3Y1_PRUDU|nr:hypothetical protein L3X38_036834 [Prunus dulcis]